MQYTVIIKRHHCENADYQSNCDCPLARAIKEQLPEIYLRGIGSNYVRIGETDEYWKFDWITWNSLSLERLMSGKIDSCSVTFTSPEKTQVLGTNDITFSNPNHEKHPAVLEAQEIINDRPESHEDRVNREDRLEEITAGARGDFALNWKEGK